MSDRLDFCVFFGAKGTIVNDAIEMSALAL